MRGLRPSGPSRRRALACLPWWRGGAILRKGVISLWTFLTTLKERFADTLDVGLEPPKESAACLPDLLTCLLRACSDRRRPLRDGLLGTIAEPEDALPRSPESVPDRLGRLGRLGNQLPAPGLLPLLPLLSWWCLTGTLRLPRRALPVRRRLAVPAVVTVALRRLPISRRRPVRTSGRTSSLRRRGRRPPVGVPRTLLPRWPLLLRS
mmetsp:Transcript_21454/g.62772  ORF Transcript_21454/g.62772 Transcript_21454/m.62772 type:complete len:207 (-) Transcript_21454:1747-2367(-)